MRGIASTMRNIDKILAPINLLLDGYGSFFGLDNRLSKLLIFESSLMQPATGVTGALGGLLILLWHRVLSVTPVNQRIEMVNGILLGMLLGSLYAPGLKFLILLLLGSLLVVLISASFTELYTRSLRLPLLGTPYTITSFMLLPACQMFYLMPAVHHLSYSMSGMPGSVTQLLDLFRPFGAIYFNGTQLGGVIIFIAFALSSRYLAVLGLLSNIVSCGIMHLLGIDTTSTIALIAEMNCLLTCAVLGGLFAAPTKTSAGVAVVAGLATTLLSLTLSRLLWNLGLPVLALPFVVMTYVCVLGLGSQRGGLWRSFWLPIPMLPEKALELNAIAHIRGVDTRSVALRAPFLGQWQIYQGFGGAHTHQGVWQYSLDFIQMRNGKSFAGVGDHRDDYFCFGAPICSPACGTVIASCTDVTDNMPGAVNTLNNWGNYLIIKLDSGGYVVLAHLKQHSLKVIPDGRVTQGQIIAQCGNSGRSPQPHLHMHVQETPTLGSRTIPFHLSSIFFKPPVEAAVQPRVETVFSLNSCPPQGASIAPSTTNLALNQGMHLAIGTILEFDCEYENGSSAIRRYEVELDQDGQFWLKGDTGSQIGFVHTDELLAFFNRNNTCDLFLDALLLAVGLTPFADGDFRWKDAVAKRFLPFTAIERIILAMLSPWKTTAQVTYTRFWDKERQLWNQTGIIATGHNQLLPVNFIAQSQLCEATGLHHISVSRNGKTVVRGKLIGIGRTGDYGIPKTPIATVHNNCKED